MQPVWLLETTGHYSCASLIRKRSQVRVLDRPLGKSLHTAIFLTAKWPVTGSSTGGVGAFWVQVRPLLSNGSRCRRTGRHHAAADRLLERLLIPRAVRTRLPRDPGRSPEKFGCLPYCYRRSLLCRASGALLSHASATGRRHCSCPEHSRSGWRPRVLQRCAYAQAGPVARQMGATFSPRSPPKPGTSR